MDLLASLAKFDQNGRNPSQKVGFELPESTVNAYLAYSLSLRPRPGIRSVKVALFPKNQVSIDVEIDFDAIQQWNSWMVPDALRAVLSGPKQIRLNAEFEADNGLLTVTWKDARSPTGILNNVLAGLLQSIGSHQPESYDTTKPLPLPFGLKRIWTEKQLIGGQT
ncbi:MAG: hypothetical protein LAQ69_30695 [Acidobacteriia bacterium]|nr:hypothetical protein [Terriglobia bacterium]